VSQNRVIKALGIPRSSLFYIRRGYPEKRIARRRDLPQEISTVIREISGNRGTYGIPRVRAILKRDHGIALSKYMVHRIMKEENLLIHRFNTRGPSRTHTGKIEVATPNTRWASDLTTIKCWNGQKLRFTYVLDCCDRSIISWIAGTHIQSCDIEKMVQNALFRRFGENLPAKGQLQFLTDNGPEYIERKLNATLKDWHIEHCTTPTYSPQSNGMCEALNGTFKRDYVYENCLDTPESVYAQIAGWVKTYNSYAPHSALGMKTPEEFFILKTAA